MNTALVIAVLSSLSVPDLSGTGFSADERWRRLEASPRISGTAGMGSAVVLGRRNNELYVLTAEHVVRKSTDLKLEFFERGSWPKVARTANYGTVVELFPIADFAVVKFEVDNSLKFPVVPLATREGRPKRFPAQGLSVGCTNGKPPTCEEAVISAKRLTRRAGNDEIAFFWETEQIPVPGRSGGPLFAPDGTLVGICAATSSGKGFYTHWDEILAGLKQRKLGWLLEPDENRVEPEMRKNR